MITVNNVAIAFDITSPADLRRYRTAGEKMTEAATQLQTPPLTMDTNEDFDLYIAYLEQQCKLLTDFIDDVFGEGVCNALLGEKTSLEKLLDIFDAIGTAVEDQGKNVGVKIKKYEPNRAARRMKR